MGPLSSNPWTSGQFVQMSQSLAQAYGNTASSSMASELSRSRSRLRQMLDTHNANVRGGSARVGGNDNRTGDEVLKKYYDSYWIFPTRGEQEHKRRCPKRTKKG